MSRYLFAFVIAAIALAHFFRYQLQPAPTADSSVIYRLDRWTGRVTVIGQYVDNGYYAEYEVERVEK